jgi:hypothetical protein
MYYLGQFSGTTMRKERKKTLVTDVLIIDAVKAIPLEPRSGGIS